jgi:hypothetical protein
MIALVALIRGCVAHRRRVVAYRAPGVVVETSWVVAGVRRRRSRGRGRRGRRALADLSPTASSVAVREAVAALSLFFLAQFSAAP